jgi:hypothetical protein
MLSPLYRILAGHANRLAQLRCAATALAAERFRLQHGRWPESTDELVPEFLESAPVDPFTDTAMHWQVDAEGLTIYSVGENGLDDNGQIRLESRTSAWPLDVGFRLINPESRAFRIKPAPEGE